MRRQEEESAHAGICGKSYLKFDLFADGLFRCSRRYEFIANGVVMMKNTTTGPILPDRRIINSYLSIGITILTSAKRIY